MDEKNIMTQLGYIIMNLKTKITPEDSRLIKEQLEGLANFVRQEERERAKKIIEGTFYHSLGLDGPVSIPTAIKNMKQEALKKLNSTEN